VRVGGHDVVLEGLRRGDEARIVVNELRVLWPNVVVQHASSYEPSPSPDDPSIDTMTEFFAFPGMAAFELWRNWRDGPEPASMVHVLVGDKTLTYVMGGSDLRLNEQMSRIFSDVQQMRLGGSSR
jgi:hypothetical protein